MRILQIARVNGMVLYECHNLGEIQANKRYRIDSGTFRSLMHVTLADQPSPKLFFALHILTPNSPLELRTSFLDYP